MAKSAEVFTLLWAQQYTDMILLDKKFRNCWIQGLFSEKYPILTCKNQLRYWVWETNYALPCFALPCFALPCHGILLNQSSDQIKFGFELWQLFCAGLGKYMSRRKYCSFVLSKITKSKQELGYSIDIILMVRSNLVASFWVCWLFSSKCINVICWRFYCIITE